ncbi:MAG: acyl-CoA dehydrogenase family protein [Actinobacteria bacterium]|nr:acyl-CoA dehydrogenase family protein [Actinomycetota bacterium]
MAASDGLNQAPPLEAYDLYAENLPLAEALRREGGAWAETAASAFGSLLGDEALAWGVEANRNPPVLRALDRSGRRLDEVEFHPAWHRLLALGVEHGLHALPWRQPGPGAHVARAALFTMLAGVEAGVGCPLSMTYAAVPALRATADLAAEWEPLLTASDYDPRPVPAGEKAGALCGMGMTERQGGSDVRANLTSATPLRGGEYVLEGHKWFCSAPMCDAFLVLAQAPPGLSCFLLPRILPDGARNGVHLVRLKDKLGNRSNASAEIELHGALARLVGEEGRGVQAIAEMINHTRLDCVLGTAGLMRAAVAEATHYAAHRTSFGRRVIDHPLQRNVLADLCLESEAATATAMRLARAYDEAALDEAQAHFRRLATAVAKYWVCKRGPALTAEALECLGGNGFVEDFGVARLYRESPLNSIWEGTGNVNCLDVLRILAKTPAAREAFLAELALSAGGDERLDRFVSGLAGALARPDEGSARRLVGALALALQGSLLVRHAPAAVADAFCASRLSGDGGLAFGTLPAGLELEAIVERHRPHARAEAGARAG